MAMIVEWFEVQSLNITHTTKFLGAMKTLQLGWHKYEACPESIQPFWISQELVRWPWCNLAASHRRSYCTSMNSCSPTGLVSQQWGAIDSACVLCDHHIHKSSHFQRWFWENQKSQGTKSGLQGCWQTWVMWCFAKKACTRAVEWAGALMQIRSSARSVRVNATVTQNTSSVNSVSLPTY